jgi:tRNA (mo5U34)-methyltransferase
MRILRRFSPKQPEPLKPSELTCAMSSARPVSDAETHKLQQDLAALAPWFHNYEIAKGVWTNAGGDGPGRDYPARRWNQIAPWFSEMAGKTVLDVGCSSGFFSLKAAELGASVVGIDSGEQNRALDQARFAQGVLKLQANFQTLSVYDSPELGRTFDMVLFMGVFYHLRHPLLALEVLRKVCTGSLIFQTNTTPNEQHVRAIPGVARDVQLNSSEMLDSHFPAMKFVEGGLGGDLSCWFVPNVEGAAAMLRSCGFVPRDFVFPDSREVFVRCTVD